jgi:hypothetical protein
MSQPNPIRPEGMFDGLRWSWVFRGALLDLALTIAGSIALTLWLAGSAAFSQDEAVAREALERAFSSPEGLAAGALLGLTATLVGAWYGARGAGVLHVRHGGWIAVMSLVLGLPLQLAGGGSDYPFWYEALGMTAMLPVGMLGGLLASRRAT